MADFDQARYHAFVLLEDLPSNLFYHGIRHTRDDVLHAAERLAVMEGVDEEDLLLLRTAALYHDIGYLEQYVKNEPIGVRIASEMLPAFGYSRGQIERIGQIIMATQLQMVDGKFVQVPDGNDLLQQLMCDADLDSLGREDFFIIGEGLRLELGRYGMPKTLREWYEGQIAFQEAHSYFTNSAQMLRNAGKQRNVRELKEVLGIGV